MPKAKIKKAQGGGKVAKKILRKSKVFTLHEKQGEMKRMSPGSWQTVVAGVKNKHGNICEVAGTLKTWADEEGLEHFKSVLTEECRSCE